MRNEFLESRDVRERRAVSKAHDVGLQGRKFASRSSVRRRIEGGEPEGLGKAGAIRHGIPVKEYISEDQDPVPFPPEGEMSRGVSWRLDHRETPDLGAVRQDTSHGMSGTSQAT